MTNPQSEDLVRRLRQRGEVYKYPTDNAFPARFVPDQDCKEAADLIEQLEREKDEVLEVAKTAAEGIADLAFNMPPPNPHTPIIVAFAQAFQRQLTAIAKRRVNGE